MDDDQNNISAIIEDAPHQSAPIEDEPSPIVDDVETSSPPDDDDTQLEKPKKPRRRKKAIDNVPSYIQKNAQRGLDLLEFAGDGLVERTIREARRMANGEISDDKARRMSAWFARHEVDLESDRAKDFIAGTISEPPPGVVSWLLWGGSLPQSERMNAQKWAARQVEQMDEEKSIRYDFYGWEDPTVKFLGLPPVKRYKTEEDKKRRDEEKKKRMGRRRRQKRGEEKRRKKRSEK